MQIQEIKDEKIHLEQNIIKLIHDFYTKTGVRVTDIRFNETVVSTVYGEDVFITRVDCEVKL